MYECVGCAVLEMDVFEPLKSCAECGMLFNYIELEGVAAHDKKNRGKRKAISS